MSLPPLKFPSQRGARCSSVIRAFAHDAMGRRIDPSWSYFSFHPVLHDWCNKGCGMCYPVCGMVHIREPLLLIGKRSPTTHLFIVSVRYFSIPSIHLNRDSYSLFPIIVTRCPSCTKVTEVFCTVDRNLVFERVDAGWTDGQTTDCGTRSGKRNTGR